MNAQRMPARVSVCIVTFNQARYLRHCVESVLSQAGIGGVELEIIVGDDASDDDTPDVLADITSEYAGNVLVVRQDTNVGPARNYMATWAVATGTYIAHLDGDDFWLPNKLQRQIAFLDAHPECGAVCSNALVVDARDRPSGVFTNRQMETFELDYLLVGGNFLTHSSVLYRAEALSELRSATPPFLDLEIMIRLMRKGRMGFLNEELVCYRANMPHSIQRADASAVRELYLDALLNALPTVTPAVARRACSNYLAYRFAFAVQRRAPLPSWVEVTRISHACRTSVHILCALALERMVLIGSKKMKAKAFGIWDGPSGMIHHPRY